MSEIKTEKMIICPDCGGPGLERTFQNLCSGCQEKRRLSIIQAERRRVRIAKRDTLQAALRDAVPAKYKNVHLNDLPRKLQEIIKYSENLLLWGNVGVGKTHAALAALRHCIGLQRSIRFVNWESFMIELRDFDHGTEAKKLNDLIRPAVLVIDDVGLSASDYSSKALFILIDQRLNQSKKTILTANIPLEELEALYGQRIGSRLSEYRIIRLNGKDRRKEKADAKENRQSNLPGM